MIKRTSKNVLNGFLIAFILNSQALAENNKDQAIIKKVKNKVEFKYEDNLWSDAKVNQVIIPVSSIRTGDLSRTELLFSDGTVTRIGSRASFTLLDRHNRAVNVQFGRVWFDVKKKSRGLKIYTPNAVGSITGTEGFIEFFGSQQEETNVYFVKAGDTLNAIARKFTGENSNPKDINNFVENILKLNPNLVKDKNHIHQGYKLIINNNSNTTNKTESYFALGLIEGTSDVYKTDKTGEATGEAQKVKEGEVLLLKGGRFSIQNLSAFLKVPQGMIPIKGSTFKMGGDGESDEKPIHEVSISSFYIGKYEVTQAEYKTIMGKNPSNFKGENLPVENVSWWDAIKYCNAKSIKEKLPISYDEATGSLLDADGKITKDITEVVGYRLPTEAEWEYVAKGAYKSSNYTFSGSNNPDEVAWYGYEQADKITHKVGSKKANEMGVFDMSGNVSEWVYDAYLSDSYSRMKNNVNPYFEPINKNSYRVYRGGSWDYIEKHQRVFSRSGYLSEFKAENIGFRIVKNISF